MTVRAATEADIAAIVAIGARFHAMSPHRFMGEYDPAGIENTVRYLGVDVEDALLLAERTEI